MSKPGDLRSLDDMSLTGVYIILEFVINRTYEKYEIYKIVTNFFWSRKKQYKN
jgi:hypothetical protein